MTEPDRDLVTELANHRRTFLAIAEAFIAAAGRLEGYDVPQHVVVRHLQAELAAREMTIDLAALDLALLCFVGLEAGKIGVGPREIIDGHWRSAPTLDQWNQMVAAHRERRR